MKRTGCAHLIHRNPQGWTSSDAQAGHETIGKSPASLTRPGHDQDWNLMNTECTNARAAVKAADT